MDVDVREERASPLDLYAGLSIAYEVSEVFDVADDPSSGGGFLLSPRRVDTPYVKDYDADSGEGPAEWGRRFDLANWGFLLARSGGVLVGGAAVAFDTKGLSMLEGRQDLAVLWDLRVAPEARGQGVGPALFRAAEAWARARGCRELKVETQNTNVPACRFYARSGCTVRAIDRFAYPALPHEIQLLWYKGL